MERHKVGDSFEMVLYELPDLLRTRPYLVLVGLGQDRFLAEPFATQTEARVFMERMMQEHLPADLINLLHGMRNQLIDQKSSAMNDK